MAVSKDNKRIIVTLPKDKEEEVSKFAIAENRTVSNMAATLILEALKIRQENK